MLEVLAFVPGLPFDCSALALNPCRKLGSVPLRKALQVSGIQGIVWTWFFAVVVSGVESRPALTRLFKAHNAAIRQAAANDIDSRVRGLRLRCNEYGESLFC
ncbi:hypothetical protein CA13_10400 [Planctomycetes bacterium CA13]|uniref:Uncharacterized protein n=1 Tax=Novipirellula herctigrandis TaxID=2527986 RepID=A0A5C5YY87_9BACT|nr:hypothetical protein CA13_10400 [Planctomycetes bacterium CA13]